jgi:hypothetical protein
MATERRSGRQGPKHRLGQLLGGGVEDLLLLFLFHFYQAVFHMQKLPSGYLQGPPSGGA